MGSGYSVSFVLGALGDFWLVKVIALEVGSLFSGCLWLGLSGWLISFYLLNPSN